MEDVSFEGQGRERNLGKNILLSKETMKSGDSILMKGSGLFN